MARDDHSAQSAQKGNMGMGGVEGSRACSERQLVQTHHTYQAWCIDALGHRPRVMVGTILIARAHAAQQLHVHCASAFTIHIVVRLRGHIQAYARPIQKCMYVFMNTCMQVHMYVCTYACMHVCIDVGMYGGIHVCMSACMYIVMHA